MPSSDTAPYNPGEGHPQIAGTFPAFFRMVRTQANLNLCDAVRRCTLLPAQVMGFDRKGRMAVGADADLVVFDPKAIRDNAMHVDCGAPDVPPDGVDFCGAGRQAGCARQNRRKRAGRTRSAQITASFPMQNEPPEKPVVFHYQTKPSVADCASRHADTI